MAKVRVNVQIDGKKMVGYIDGDYIVVSGGKKYLKSQVTYYTI